MRLYLSSIINVYGIMLAMSFLIPEEETVLSELLPLLAEGSSRRTQLSWLKAQRVWVDGTAAKDLRMRVRAGQKVQLVPRRQEVGQGLQILYQDAHIVVVDKPAGLLSVDNDKDLTPSAHRYLKRVVHPKRVYVAHRLDRDTSGVLVFALTVEALEKLKTQFKSHSIEREYIAIVEGHPPQKSGTWESYLHEDRRYFVHSEETPGRGERAVTHYKIEARSKKYSWLELRLETGKKNQIRVHCADAGCPIAGDRKYGPSIKKAQRLCLHARHLGFIHPVTGKALRFTSPIPKVFTEFFPKGRQ